MPFSQLFESDSIDADSITDKIAHGILKRPVAAGRRGPSNRCVRSWQRAARLVAGVARPRAEHRLVPVQSAGDRVLIGGHELHRSRVARVFASCDAALVFGVTIGPDIDTLIKHHQEQNISFAYVLDRAASVAAEHAVISLERALARKLPSHLGLSRRYSPGYCDWPLDQQQILFDILPPRPAGIRLSAGNLMAPRKSVTGVIGIGRRSRLRTTANACTNCTNARCNHRRSDTGKESG